MKLYTLSGQIVQYVIYVSVKLFLECRSKVLCMCISILKFIHYLLNKLQTPQFGPKTFYLYGPFFFLCLYICETYTLFKCHNSSKGMCLLRPRGYSLHSCLGALSMAPYVVFSSVFVALPLSDWEQLKAECELTHVSICQSSWSLSSVAGTWQIFITP